MGEPIDGDPASWRAAQFEIAKQTARTGHFASIVLRVRPAATDDSISFSPEVPLTGLWPAVELGITEALDALRKNVGIGSTPVLITDSSTCRPTPPTRPRRRPRSWPR